MRLPLPNRRCGFMARLPRQRKRRAPPNKISR
jgi:hypothetical protein